MASGNQASDGKSAQMGGYEIGELEIGAPKRSTSAQNLPPAATQGGSPSGATSTAPQRGTSLTPATRASAQPGAVRATSSPAAAPVADAAAIARAYAEKAQAAVASAKPANTQSAPVQKGLGRPSAFDDTEPVGPALELDLAAVAPPKKGSPSTEKPPTHAVDLQAFGTKDLGGFDTDDDAGPALEVEEVDKARESRVTVKTAADPKAEAAKEEQLARELADYGGEPGNLIESVKYAARVARRIVALRKDRRQAADDVMRLNGEHERTLVEMGQALLPLSQQPKLQPLAARFKAVQEAHAHLASADQSMTATREQNQLALEQLGREADEVRASLQPFMQAEQEAAAVHRKADEALKRGQALVRRAEIELRALLEAKSQDPQKLDAVKAQLEAKKSEVPALEAKANEAAQALGVARRDVAMRRGSLDVIDDRKKRMLDAGKQKESEAEQHSASAAGSHASALRGLAEECIAQQLHGAVTEPYEKAKAAEQTLGAALKVLKRHERALELYDRSSVIKGACVAGGAVLALLVALTTVMC